MPPSSAKKRTPASYYEPGQWPRGTADPDAPLHVLHAAQIAICVDAWALEYGRGDRSAGLKLLSQATGIPRSTMVHLADGDRWPGIDTVGRLEWAMETAVTGITVIGNRVSQEALDQHPVHPRLHDLRQQARAQARQVLVRETGP